MIYEFPITLGVFIPNFELYFGRLAHATNYITLAKKR